VLIRGCQELDIAQGVNISEIVPNYLNDPHLTYTTDANCSFFML
jgi:hypothetical protein